MHGDDPRENLMYRDRGRGGPHRLPDEHEPGTPMPLTITATLEGHTFPVSLEPEEREMWLACFRSAFGPKVTMVEELRRERHETLADADITVSWDGTRATFYPDGRIRQELDSYAWGG